MIIAAATQRDHTLAIVMLMSSVVINEELLWWMDLDRKDGPAGAKN